MGSIIPAGKLIGGIAGDILSAVKPTTATALKIADDATKAGSAARVGEIVAQNGTKITGFTKHGIDRVLGDGAKRVGVKPEALLDALRNPKKITSGVDSQGRPYQVFTGQDARVVVNPETGQVVSTNPLSGAGGH